ncbi:TIGR02281 family clan AA aspartic protease [candidate division KSB3 bacterium]|uniref:TIGR02281 family clan AA aspartic protease n=1 Tax=candidate division KSB3 bacterium TaxID=2044937 RepID=A0A9D5JYA6_9BACT|nr:TIGR02281 family clan AA aspartic protease [candidate division KSB3 bacterium]MBD3326350.1 TIGR02281 family clan AA aspartic protease [candidate division KSB3 bacterium]
MKNVIVCRRPRDQCARLLYVMGGMMQHHRMNRRRMFLIISVLGLLWMPQDLLAEIYRWKNQKGQMHYSTHPPSYPVTGTIEVKRQNQWYPYTGEETPSAPNSSSLAYTTSSPGTPLPLPPAPQAETVVPYNKENAMIIIEATVNGTLTTSFAVDTGATYTIISPDVAKALYLSPNATAPLITLQTANGRIQVPLVQLQSVAVGGVSTLNVAAAIHELQSDANISGLLGLNFLNRFRLTVDATQHQLILQTIHLPSHYTTRDCVKARDLLAQGRALNDGTTQEAASYREAIALCPDLVEAYYYLGAIYIHQKDASRAISIHRKLIALHPKEPEAYFRLGLSYMLDRNFPEAKEAFQHVLQLDPSHQQAKKYFDRLPSP